MENSEVSKIFYEIADLLEIKGDNPFRIRSYRNAARVIEGLPKPLETLVGESGVKFESIPGVGSGLHDKIIEILGSGRSSFHQELLGEIPPGVLEMLKISGIGPKKVSLLYNSLSIKGVDELEKAARTGRLSRLPGMGKRTEEKLLGAIESYRRLKESSGGRYLLDVASSYAASYVEYLHSHKDVKDATAAGSLRRRTETVGDIDILVTLKEGAAPDAASTHFVNFPEVADVAAKGPTRTSVVLKNDLQVDLRVIESGSMGAALLYFTGSKAHNVALRDRAKRMGLKINEHGVFNETDGTRVAGDTEEDVYKSVGLQWTPPELRENWGEIEAAAERRLPRLVRGVEIRGDLHVHTSESDGSAGIGEMAAAAMAMGYEYIAVTDHSKAIGIANGLDEERLFGQIGDIERYNRRLENSGVGFRLLTGGEVDILRDGSLDYSGDALAAVDCVVAAVHSGFDMTSLKMTDRIIRALATGFIDVLAHPTGRLIGSREPYRVDMEAVMDAAVEMRVIMELNSYPERLDLNDVHLRRAKEKGLLVAISTDAHSPTQLTNVSFGISTARRGWLEKRDVVNTRSLEGLLKLLKQRPRPRS